MIKDFDAIKNQLQDLAAVINSFKSEAVQLRVVELLFQRMGTESFVPEGGDTKQRTPAKKKVKKKGKVSVDKEETTKKTTPSKSGRPGPLAMVKQLKGQGFFKIPKTISDIIEHCQSKLAYTYKPNELSGAMTRVLRSGILQRKKDEQNQFKYYEQANS